MMKKLYVLFFVAGLAINAADPVDHGTNGASKEARTEAGQVTDKSQRLFQFVNACMPGGTQATDEGSPLPAVAAQGGSTPAASGNGAAVFQSRCLNCHANNGKSIAGKSGAELAARLNVDMPKAGSDEAKNITSAEREALKAFFASK